MPSNDIPLDRVHSLLDRMSSDDSRKQKLAQVRGENNDSEDDNRKADMQALSQSNQVDDAMQMTARLWSRKTQAWPDTWVDTRSSTLTNSLAHGIHTQKTKETTAN